MIKNEILIYKDTKEVWLSKIKTEQTQEETMLYSEYFCNVRFNFFRFLFLIRKLKLYVKP